MTHLLNKQRFQDAMQRRGWIMDAPTHSWIRPNGLTQATAEQDWIDAILEAVECEPNQPSQLQLERPAVNQEVLVRGIIIRIEGDAMQIRLHGLGFPRMTVVEAELHHYGGNVLWSKNFN